MIFVDKNVFYIDNDVFCDGEGETRRRKKRSEGEVESVSGHIEAAELIVVADNNLFMQ